MREKCPYSEFFWSVFSGIWIELGEIPRIYPYSVGIRENMDHKNSKYGHFLLSAVVRRYSVLKCLVSLLD